MTGLCRTKIFELIATGELDASQIGRSTLIHVESLKIIQPQKLAASQPGVDISSVTIAMRIRQEMELLWLGKREPNPQTDGQPGAMLGGAKVRCQN